MQIEVDFPGGARVDAHFGAFTVHTDQAVRDGGVGAAPSPFDLFLAATAACAGFYVQRFCQQRQIATAQLRLIQRLEVDPATGHVVKFLIELQLPPDFPPKYRAAILRAAEQCTVKKHLEHPPTFEITATWREPVAG